MTERMDAVNQIELRIELTEELLRELLWRALTPDAIVMMGALSAAITKQQERQNVSTAGYQLTSISVTLEGGSAFAELGYTLPG
ncbi:MAG TPA: hypothetical protein VFS21_14560 [Roseiflexaceae bacterium]|nr:hypothetical protein [Roseiflexaceae bacterium]